MVLVGILIAVFVVLVIFSAFFSGVETAIYSVSEIKVKELVAKKVRFADTLEELKHKRHRLLSTILIGNTLVNTTASVIATKITIMLFGDQYLAVLTGVLIFIMLIIGEFIPKSFAIAYSEYAALHAAPIINVIMIIFWPFVFLFDISSKFLMKLLGKHRYHEEITEDTIKIVVQSGEEQGVIKQKDKEIINNLLAFNRLNIKEVMIPKADMVAFSEEDQIKDIIDQVIHENYSRIPIYSGKADNITGILYLKDLLKAVNENRMNITLQSIAKKPFFVSERIKLDSLFQQFQNNKVHIAIVVSKFGNVLGLVTMEDLLEEIFGEIYDESDLIEWKIRKIDARKYLVKGNTTIAEIHARLDLNIYGTDKNETIRGYILAKLQRIPKKGDKISFKHFIIHVNRVRHHRVIDVRIVKR